jgi:glycosyltransferase involved in cell wall biosynthesis
MALIAARFAPFRLIFDVRGLMAEEYEDAGRWRRNSVPFRLAKAVERRALEKADAIVLLTERVREHILGGAEDTRVHVIPCCADIEAIEAASCRRAGVRARLGLNERTVLVYVGKFSGWYMEREMVEFFELTRELRADAHFLVLTQSDPRPIHREFARLGVEESSWTVTACPPSEIGEYLAAADAGIAFIRPSFSKISSSPTKVGEYLAAGLPLICIAGVGDVDGLVGSYDVGVSLTRWDRTMLARGAELLLDLIAKDGVAVRARRAARENLSLDDVGIPRYDQIYRSLAETW